MTRLHAKPCRDERGAGLVALPWAVLAFLTFLTLAVQAAVYFYSTSVLTAVGHDATRRAAFGGGSPAAIVDAERWLRSAIGPAVDIERLRWRTSGETVALELAARPPTVLIDADALIGLQTVERRFEVRRELARFAGSP
ncbi:hypothetical protein [Candidatus Poriferisodalis sp.]|uniref:hypothetical protein n=1 Tax=Candidatus Poriferisodalis sp. TaxID=3101277 RepID=UPI003B5929D9